MSGSSGSEWDAWIGRKQVQSDTVDAALARRWCAMFDLPVPGDSIMPQGIHLCLCTPEAPSKQLGEDGHPQRDESKSSFFPPIPLPRRMWAASEIAFFNPIRIGAEIERVSTIASVAEKEGSTGKLGFVEVEHVTTANNIEVVREKQTLVYRGSASHDAPLSPPAPGNGSFDADAWDTWETINPDPRLLFRFSALTFNTHRIHYDAPYAREVERYRGLVVHGPLMASLLLQMAARELGNNTLKDFTFRAVSPAIAGEPLHLAMRKTGDGFEFGAFASDGRQCVKSSGTL